MTENQIKANIKTCVTPESLVQWILHAINEQKNTAYENGYISGYQQGVEYMAGCAHDLINNNMIKNIEREVKSSINSRLAEIDAKQN